MGQAKYTYTYGGLCGEDKILKDGHTMFIKDVVKDITSLQAEIAKLKKSLKQKDLNNHEFAEFASKKLNRFQEENGKLKTENERLKEVIKETVDGHRVTVTCACGIINLVKLNSTETHYCQCGMALPVLFNR